MPDTTPQTTSNSSSQVLPPPSGDVTKAEKYLNWLRDLLSQDKIHAVQTDLKNFNSPTLRDHYHITLRDYVVEVSHNYNQATDKHTYIMLFTNLKKVQSGLTDKIILAYIPLTAQQFQEFEYAATEQSNRRKREEEEKRFREVMAPFDKALEELTTPAVEETIETPPSETSNNTENLEDTPSLTSQFENTPDLSELANSTTSQTTDEQPENESQTTPPQPV